MSEIHPAEQLRKERRLTAEQVVRCCGEEEFAFETTRELNPLASGIIGQPRAVQAMDFGLRVPTQGYNLFLTGLPGTGKTTYAEAKVREVAKERPVPLDWCYVYNFQQPDRPVALSFPPGMGARFRQDMNQLIEELRTEIRRAFDSEQYESRRAETVEQGEREASRVWQQLEEDARALDFIVQRTPTGVLTAPLTPQGKPYTPEQFAALDEATRERLAEVGREVQARVAEALRRIRKVEREARERLRNLERETARYAADHLIQALKDQYAGMDEVQAYLDQVAQDVVEHLDLFRRDGSEEDGHPLQIMMRRAAPGEDPFLRYRVNLFVSHAETQGAPVVIEPNPTYYNLLGRVEYRGEFGTLRTDFTMIKPGAIHMANGGYLIIQARDLLSNAMAWPALKRALKMRQAAIENLAEQMGLVATTSLRPQPIPLNVKVILIGHPLLYQLLYAYDEDFRKLFKIRVDFETVMERNRENELDYARFIAAYCEREGLLPFDRSGVARVIEYSSRLAENQTKLSTRFNEIVEILAEASVWASREGATVVTKHHVRQAIEAKAYRSNQVEERIFEMIERGSLLVDTDGWKVGQVNGIAVLSLGDHAFGKPTRITARTALGTRGIVNIEREADLSGRIHSKGVLILAAYLAGKYAQDKPLSLSASITFEQSYNEVDGDSASTAELYTLLSELSGLPIDQGIAVTGSVNQKGEVQPVGGINEKIEGFYHACKMRGLTGRQGVIIPQANVENLMLKEEVVAAIADGRFHVWAVRTVDEGITILTGVPAGERDENGCYPEGTVNDRVDRRLREMARLLQEFSREDGEGAGAEDEPSPDEETDDEPGEEDPVEPPVDEPDPRGRGVR